MITGISSQKCQGCFLSSTKAGQGEFACLIIMPFPLHPLPTSCNNNAHVLQVANMSLFARTRAKRRIPRIMYLTSYCMEQQSFHAALTFRRQRKRGIASSRLPIVLLLTATNDTVMAGTPKALFGVGPLVSLFSMLAALSCFSPR